LNSYGIEREGEWQNGNFIRWLSNDEDDDKDKG